VSKFKDSSRITLRAPAAGGNALKKLKVIYGEGPARVQRVSRVSPGLPCSVWRVQLRLLGCVQIVDTSLPHNSKCRYSSLPVAGSPGSKRAQDCPPSSGADLDAALL
jgi:hypothetical protein